MTAFRWFSAAIAVAAIASAAIASAGATTPGSNGKIAFSRYLTTAKKTRAIFVVNPDGSGLVQLTHPAVGVQDQNPDWSSDGKWVAFSRCASRCEVRIVAARGGAPKRIGPNCQNSQPPACEDRDSPAWAPNGQTLAMDRGWGPVSHNTIEYSDVALTDAEGGHVHELVVPKAYWGDVKRAHWAPDGKQLVIEEDDSGWKASGPGKGHKALFVINPNGTGLRQLTPWSLDAGDADWAPDGKLILFRSEPHDNDDGPGGNLYTIHPDGTSMHRLTDYAGSMIVLSSSFSPDGKSIVFSKTGTQGEPNIYTMNADGTNVQPVTHTSLWESQADWGPTSH